MKRLPFFLGFIASAGLFLSGCAEQDAGTAAASTTGPASVFGTGGTATTDANAAGTGAPGASGTLGGVGGGTGGTGVGNGTGGR